MIIKQYRIIKLMYENSWLVFIQSVNIQNSLCGSYERHDVKIKYNLKKKKRKKEKKRKSDMFLNSRVDESLIWLEIKNTNEIHKS